MVLEKPWSVSCYPRRLSNVDEGKSTGNGREEISVRKILWVVVAGLLAVVTTGTSLSAFGFLGLGGDSWKEEVVLHDGSVLVVSRSQTYGGRREIGQTPPIREHTVRFSLPGSRETLTWVSEYGEELGRTNFDLIAVHVANGVPYVVATPNLCLSYNKWGRPNPPYVIFRYDGQAWQRIPLAELPAEFKTINVVVYLTDYQVAQMVRLGLVTKETVAELNQRTVQAEFKNLVREPIPKGTHGSDVNCIELVLYKGSWIMPNDPIMRKILDQRGN